MSGWRRRIRGAIGMGITFRMFRSWGFKRSAVTLSMLTSGIWNNFAKLALPVLAVVPRMRSESERQREFKRSIILGLGLGTTVMVCLAVLVYSYFR